MYGKPASEEGALEKARAGLRNAAACSAEYRAAEAAYGERAMNAEHPAVRAPAGARPREGGAAAGRRARSVLRAALHRLRGFMNALVHKSDNE